MCTSSFLPASWIILPLLAHHYFSLLPGIMPRPRKSAPAPSVEVLLAALTAKIDDNTKVVADRLTALEGAVPAPATDGRVPVEAPKTTTRAGRKAAAAAAALRRQPSEDEEEEDDVTFLPRRPGKLKSGRNWVEEAEVLLVVPWPNQEVFNIVTGKRPAPEELTLAEFVYGYLIQSAKAPAHLATPRSQVILEILDDAQAYQWDKVRAAHFAFLEKLEHGAAKWSDREARAELRRKLVWPHPIAAATSRVALSASAARKKTSVAAAVERPPCAYCLEKKGEKYNHLLASCRRRMQDQAAAHHAPGNLAAGN